ncbi:hypothetical protein R1flu_008992 [Riccia fluitans]|uniref:Uncharacterized protein n=1 Tax=Riccia fluitans TaxID=41844 RepID=A0ABD1Z1N6_9MARC
MRTCVIEAFVSRERSNLCLPVLATAGGIVNRSGGASTQAASLLLLVMISVHGVAATEIPVGGTLGWRLGVDYSDWAKSVKIRRTKKFQKCLECCFCTILAPKYKGIA